jgi:hypothetical protein
MDNQGYHILEKIIATFSEDQWEFLLEPLKTDFESIANDKHGACFLKELIKNTRNPTTQKLICSKIELNCLEFVQNSHANFVV